MPPPAGDPNYTIMDEELMQPGPSASETILDEDMFSAGGVGSETILDEDFVSGSRENVTVLGEDLTDYEAKPLPTATPEDLPQRQEKPKNKGFELVWKVDEDKPTAPSQPKPPTDKPGIQKTEVLHYTADTNAWLVIGSGERRGEQFRLTADTLIGRDTTNDIVIDDTAMSNVHVRIRSENDRFFVFDQNSTNGVFIFDNAKQRWEKRDAYELNNGDQIKVGRTVLHFMTS
jgi:pSer/pThr/pTyr-binding forkhead associated (FHA) protein